MNLSVADQKVQTLKQSIKYNIMALRLTYCVSSEATQQHRFSITHFLLVQNTLTLESIRPTIRTMTNCDDPQPRGSSAMTTMIHKDSSFIAHVSLYPLFTVSTNG